MRLSKHHAWTASEFTPSCQLPSAVLRRLLLNTALHSTTLASKGTTWIGIAESTRNCASSECSRVGAKELTPPKLTRKSRSPKRPRFLPPTALLRRTRYLLRRISQETFGGVRRTTRCCPSRFRVTTPRLAQRLLIQQTGVFLPLKSAPCGTMAPPTR